MSYYLPKNTLKVDNDDVENVLKKLAKHQTEYYGVYWSGEHPEVFDMTNEYNHNHLAKFGFATIDHELINNEYKFTLEINVVSPPDEEGNLSKTKIIYQSTYNSNMPYNFISSSSSTETSNNDNDQILESEYDEVSLGCDNKYEFVSIKNGKKKVTKRSAPLMTLNYLFADGAYIERSKHTIGEKFTMIELDIAQSSFIRMDLKLDDFYKLKGDRFFCFEITKHSLQKQLEDEIGSIYNKNLKDVLILKSNHVVDTMRIGPMLFINEPKKDQIKIQQLADF